MGPTLLVVAITMKVKERVKRGCSLAEKKTETQLLVGRLSVSLISYRQLLCHTRHVWFNVRLVLYSGPQRLGALDRIA